MPSKVVKIKLEQSIQMKRAHEFPLFKGDSVEVVCIQGPAEVGPFATDEQLSSLVNHVLAFYKDVVHVYDLGDNLHPIAVAKGKSESFIAGEGRYYEDDDSIHYTVDSHGFDSLGAALVFALATRDRGNPNDARPTAACIMRLLTAVD